MKKTRRSFLQMLAAIPLIGPALAHAEPLTLVDHVGVVAPTPEAPVAPLYGFDERLTLNGMYGDGKCSFIAGEDLRRGEFVVFRSTLPDHGRFYIVRAGNDDKPAGMLLTDTPEGGDVGDSVLVKGWVNIKVV